MRTDEQLVEEALRGSVEAFSTLVDRYGDRLLRFLLTRCASRADAEDALQDTFANAYRYLDSYDSRWRFSTWIYRIAIRNAARGMALQQGAVEVEDLTDETADPLGECIRSSERENLWLVARNLLSEDVYAAMWLHYVEDMRVREVADALDKSLSWTKVSLMRARNALADELRQTSSAAGAEESKSYG